MVGVGMFQDGLLHECLLQDLEHLLLGGTPLKQDLFLKELSEGCRQGNKAGEKCLIVVG